MFNPYTGPANANSLIQFTGGLNSTAGPLSLSNEESSKLQNVDFDKFGSIVKRGGYLNVNSSAFNSSARWTGLLNYELSTGVKNLVGVCGNKVAYWSAASITGAPTDITGSITVTPGNLASSTVFRDRAFFTNGADLPFQWTGSGNCSVQTVPTGLTTAKFNGVFSGYFFLANTVVTGTSHRSRIHYSNINQPNIWTDLDFVDLSPDDGQQITGIIVLGTSLIIFKDKSIWTVQFTGNADTPFQFNQSNSAVGTVSHQSLQQIDNGVVFLSWDGLYYFDGYNSYKISDRLNQTFQNDMATLQFANVTSMFQHTKNRYWLGISSSGSSTNDTVITWTKSNTTTKTDAFSIQKGMMPSIMCMVYPDGITEKPYFGDYSGFMYNADTGVDDYPLGVQTAINSYYYTNWITFDDICNQKDTLSVYLYYQNNTATTTFVYSYDLNDQDQYTRTFSTSTGGALWDTAVWDVDVWAGGTAATQRFDITGRGRLTRFGIKNSNLSETFRIDGIGALSQVDSYI